MKIAIIGASAGVGLATVQRALARRHQVVTLSRTIDSLPQHGNLSVIKGSATNTADLKNALQNVDAVLVTLGTGKNIKATNLYTDTAKSLLAVQQELQLNVPFVILTGFGAGESAKYHGNFLMKLVFKFILNKVYDNKTAMEELIAQSPLRWIIVRPGVLNDQPLSEKYRIENRYFKGMNIGSISRQDVADFMVKQAENPTAIHQYPALSQQ